MKADLFLYVLISSVAYIIFKYFRALYIYANYIISKLKKNLPLESYDVHWS